MISTEPEPIAASGTPSPGTSPPLRELDLFELALLLLRNARMIALCGILGFVAAMIFVLFAKPRFSSTAVMIVPQTGLTNQTLGTQLSQLSLNPMDLLTGAYAIYSDILSSRSVRDRVIRDNNLETVYHTHKLATAEAILLGRTKIETEREGLIRVTVQDASPQRSADIANDYLRQLDEMNSQLVLTTVAQERAFLERELAKEKDVLANAEVALQQVQESIRGLPPEAQATAGLSALETTRAELRADQIRLASLLTGATESNPEVVRLRSQISSLDAQVQQLQEGTSSELNGTPTSQVPVESLEYARRLRDVKFHESLYELLEKEYEQAKEEEAKTPSIVQVLDPAVPPDHKSWPPRVLYCLLGLVVGVLAGILLVCCRAFAFAYLHNPANSVKLMQVRRLLHRS